MTRIILTVTFIIINNSLHYWMDGDVFPAGTTKKKKEKIDSRDSCFVRQA